MTEQEAAVWFAVELRDGKVSPESLGLAAEAGRLARALGSRAAGVLLGAGVAALAREVPASVVYLGEHAALAEGNPEAVATALAQVVQGGSPSVLLLAATPAGSDLAPRSAAKLGTGLASGCLRLDVDSDGLLLMLRPAFAGRASCTVVCPSRRPQMATLLPDSLPSGSPGPTAEPKVVPVALDLDGFRPKTIVQRIERMPPSSMSVTQAEVVVAGGRGVGGQQGFQRLEEIAGLLGGTVAASRPAVDAGWAPASRQVGSSGKVVSPRLYIACGISGASQHVVGMRDSQMVVAINRDAHAPIVSMADLALVGDLGELLPCLLTRLRSLVGPQQSAPDGGYRGPPSGDNGSTPDIGCVAVCLSRSLDPEAHFDARDPAQIERTPRVMGPADLHALEEALSLRDRIPNVRVVALHVGPVEGEDVLRQALALGADEAVRLGDEAFAGSDSLCTAGILAAAIRRLGASMVLCGSRGGDGQSGQLPLQLGELLGAAAVPDVLAIAAGGVDYVIAQRRLEWGRRAVVRCPLPAVLAVEAGSNRPRYPRLRHLLAARERPIGLWGCAELGLAEEEVGSSGSAIEVLKVGPPKPVARVVLEPEELSAEERLRQVMGGGGAVGGNAGASRSNIVRGSPDQLADEFLRFLLAHRFVRAMPD